MSARQPAGEALRIELEASLEAVDRAVGTAEEILEGVLPLSSRFGLLLGLREALTNAVLHGSGSDPGKTVTCKITIDCNTIAFEVSDQGEGFEWKKLAGGFPDPTTPGHRGFGIMNNYFDGCKYNKKGNKLLLTKRRL